jgi:DNA-binding NtrC family response regulator
MGALPLAMPAALKFLVVDFHRESRYLLVRTLQRKFPQAEIVECEDVACTAHSLQAGDVSAIITHRTFDVTGVELVRQFKATAPSIPVLMVSGMDRSQEAKAAGGDGVLHYDEWLRLGSAVEAMLAGRA